MPPKRSLNDVKPRTCSKLAGLSTQMRSQHGECTLKWPWHVAQCIHNNKVILRRPRCSADFKSEWRGTENISQCSQSERSCSENHFAGYESCTENIYDLFTNVSQIYGCFFPRDLVTSHFINLYLTIMVFQYLESTVHTLVVATNLGQALRLSGTTLDKMVWIK